MFRRVTLAFVLAALLTPATTYADDAEATMADTKAWLEGEGMALMRGLSSQDNRRLGVFMLVNYSVSDLHVDNCVISWTDHFDTRLQVPSSEPEIKKNTSRVQLQLKDLDTGGIGVRMTTVLSDVAIPIVQIPLRTQAITTNGTNGASIHVRSTEDGERVASAVRRAAILCGAQISPF